MPFVKGQADNPGFVKGQTGNPGGRPRGLARTVREEVGTEGWIDLVREMLDIALGAHPEAKPKDQIAAAAWLTDRGFGRPQQSVDITSDGQRVVGGGSVVVPLPVGEMSDDGLAALRKTLERAGASSSAPVAVDEDAPPGDE